MKHQQGGIKLIHLILIVAIAAVGFWWFTSGNPEAASQKIYAEAMAKERNGHPLEAQQLYQQLMDKYPTTEAGIKVAEKMAVATRINNIANGNSQEQQYNQLKNLLELYRLKHGKYPENLVQLGTETGFKEEYWSMLDGWDYRPQKQNSAYQLNLK